MPTDGLWLNADFYAISRSRAVKKINRKKLEWVISRILYPAMRVMIIYLGHRSPGTSSDLPGNFGRAALRRFPI
jgi:hypothetical protein